MSFKSATVVRSITLDAVPSGSALHLSDDGALYIISDDAPFVYRCSVDGSRIDSIPFDFLPTNFHRIPKPQKPDFEASVVGNVAGAECLVAFGSGSVETVRDSGATLQLSDTKKQQHFSLSQFYAHIRSSLSIASKDFNIEGAALQNDRLVLFNRGTNHLIQTSFQSLMDHVLKGVPPPAVTGKIINLAKTGDYITGISGAAFLNDEHLVFCASVEATADWFHDGEVLGSYIGILHLTHQDDPKIVSYFPILDDNGNRAKEKLESIIARKVAKGPHVIALVDNDDGTSRLLYIDVGL